MQLTLLTADYPGVVRRIMAERLRGGPMLFVTGCAGDANTGHTAAASISTAPSAGRTFEACERVGTRIAAAALALTPPASRGRPGARAVVGAGSGEVRLELEVPDRAKVLADTERWEQEAAAADSARRALLACWAEWGRGLLNQTEPGGGASLLLPVTVLRWGGAVVVAFPAPSPAAPPNRWCSAPCSCSTSCADETSARGSGNVCPGGRQPGGLPAPRAAPDEAQISALVATARGGNLDTCYTLEPGWSSCIP